MSFRPERIRLLFIGEAPPASGRFFYSRNSGLYHAVRESFEAADPGLHDEDFLAAFRASGCYLIDLCPNPVDRLDPASRLRARLSAERLLAKDLVQLRPERIAAVLRAITDHVDKAALRANWQGEVIRLPYPGRWSRHRAAFVKALQYTVRELLR